MTISHGMQLQSNQVPKSESIKYRIQIQLGLNKIWIDISMIKIQIYDMQKKKKKHEA